MESVETEPNHENVIIPDIIKPIGKGTVHRICSGQVVLNLAIAVKELIENAIDAKATNIDVRLVEYGSILIEVVDNGNGVRSENFEALALKHYTSKMREFTDLETVGTLGFRGEALSSLCALSDLTITTRHASVEHGTKINFDYNGHITSQSICARQVGTTVAISNLFTTLPVRRKEFLKNLKRDFNKMCNLLYAYCLVSEGIKFTCTNQTKAGSRNTVVSTLGGNSVEENIICVFGPKQLSPLIEIITAKPNDAILEDFKLQNLENMEISFTLSGMISSCVHGSGRSAADRQFYYINSRPCEPGKVMKLVNVIYKQFNCNQYPFVYLNIKMEKNQVDVNITPDKRQVYVQNEKMLLATIKMSLCETFKSIPSTFKIQPPLDIKLDAKAELAERMKNVLMDISISQQRGTKRLISEEDTEENVETKVICRNKKNFLVQQSIKNFGTPILSENESEEEEEIMSDNKKEQTAKVASSTKSECENLCGIDSNKKILPKEKTNEHLMMLKQRLLNKQEHKRNEEHPQMSDEENETFLNENSEVKLDTPSQNKSKSLVFCHTTMESIKQKLAKRSKINSSKDAMDFNLFHSQINPESNETAQKELEKQIDKSSFKKMSIIGQFNRGFIITKLNSDLFIIDQHATDEKYNFETLQQSTVLETQMLVNPKPLQLTTASENVLIENEEIFKKNGFLFQIDEEAEATKKVLLTAIPMSKNYVFGKDDIDEMIFMLEDSPQTMCRPSRVRSMFASRACRSSVMIGSALSTSDMRRLVDHMGEIEQPWNCPHGRPTMRHLINLNLLLNKL